MLGEPPEELRRKLTETDRQLFEAVRDEYGLSVGIGAASLIADVVQRIA
jgi:hypothetical protein